MDSDVYNPIKETETHRFLKRILAKPNQLQAHIRHTASTVVVRISCYDLNENNDPLLTSLHVCPGMHNSEGVD
ncbi:hypothetical protein DFJ58DRAFT_721031 [Suillus subalutaceus]|uniref:uncharacterized protein n=1 Tax=Suillus subalutaceus TaxID=48586 RepID=UPI001B87DE03|nr:uncharacterized protein DFJ58DRAFT_721031 [Suillus subalutaceus]KAG1876567.1 hypothetical protein DFJ58DRAFT_721031 [Suillus subalutaceus]